MSQNNHELLNHELDSLTETYVSSLFILEVVTGRRIKVPAPDWLHSWKQKIDFLLSENGRLCGNFWNSTWDVWHTITSQRYSPVSLPATWKHRDDRFKWGTWSFTKIHKKKHRLTWGRPLCSRHYYSCGQLQWRGSHAIISHLWLRRVTGNPRTLQRAFGHRFLSRRPCAVLGPWSPGAFARAGVWTWSSIDRVDELVFATICHAKWTALRLKEVSGFIKGSGVADFKAF